MPAINRFSTVKPAKFNPLSAEEIMRVPMLKGALEQEQLSLVEGARLDMLNAKIAPGDKARVMKEQDRLTEGFDSLVSDITTNGVGYKTTSNINNYMKDYNTSMSSTGVIGGATDYYAARKEERKSAKQNAIRNNYDMAAYSAMEANYDNQQSSFDQDGKQSYGEYQGFYLPENIDIGRMLEAEVNKLGGMSVTDTDGSSESTNAFNLRKAQDMVIANFREKDSYKKLKQYANYSDEYIAEQLENKAMIMTSAATKGPKYVKPTVADEPEVDPGATEKILSVYEGALTPGKFDLSKEGMEAAFKLEDPEERAKHMDFFKKSTDRFNKRDDVVLMTKDIDDKKAIVVTEASITKEDGTNNIYKTKAEADVAYNATKSEDRYEYTPEPYLIRGEASSTVVPFEVNGEEHYAVVDNKNKALRNYQDVVEHKEKEFQLFAGPDSVHSYGKVYSVNTKSAQSGSGKNKAQSERYKEGVVKTAVVAEPYQLKNVTYGGKATGETETTNVEGEELKLNELVQERLETLRSGDITNIEHQLGSTYNLPSIRVSFEGLDLEGKNKVAYSVTIEQPESLRNLSGEELRTNKNPFNLSMTSDLNITDETAKYAEHYINYGDTQNVKVAYDRPSFGSSDHLKNLISDTESGRKFAKSKGKISIQENKGGGFSVIEQVNSSANRHGVNDPISVSELLKAKGIKLPLKGNHSSQEWNNLVKKQGVNNVLLGIIIAKNNEMRAANGGDPIKTSDLMFALASDDSDLVLQTKEDAIDILK